MSVEIECKLKKKCSSLYEFYEVIKQFCSDKWETPIMCHYTSHNIGHTKKMLDYLDEIVPLANPPLNSDELYVLLSSAFLHDISMQFPKKIFPDKSLTDLTLSDFEKIRKDHRKTIKDVINKDLFEYFKEQKNKNHFPYHSYISAICENHHTSHAGTDYLKTIKVLGGENIRINLLTALIQCVDALHISKNRLNKGIEPDVLPIESKKYWWKNYYTSEVLVDERFKRISVHFVIPENFIDHMDIFSKFVEINFRGFRGDALDVLWDHGIYLKVGGHEPWVMIDDTKKMMPNDVIEDIKSFINKRENNYNKKVSISIKNIINDQIERRIIETISMFNTTEIENISKQIREISKGKILNICEDLCKRKILRKEEKMRNVHYSLLGKNNF